MKNMEDMNSGDKNIIHMDDNKLPPPEQTSKKNKKRLSSSVSLMKKEAEKIWEDLIGDEIKWRDMTTQQKIKRIIANIIKFIGVLGCLYFFVCSLELLSISFRLISGKSTGAVMSNEYISNPIVGLMIGILVTVLVQSSSTSTSIIVSMVASGMLSVHDAIPMIMGSNIGTSVTSTIVALTQANHREQFRRAFSGATVHDMFNWLSVFVLLPLEVITGVIESLTSLIVDSFSSGEGAEVELLSVITDALTSLIVQLDSRIVDCWGMGFLEEEESMIKKYCKYDKPNKTTFAPESTITSTTEGSSTLIYSSLSVTSYPEVCEEPEGVGVPNSCNFLFYDTGLSDILVGVILLLISLTVLCTSLILIVKILNSMLKGSIARIIQKVINANIPYLPWLTGYLAMVIGACLTFVVQSSSVFTSTLTPLIGIGMITVERAYPLTLGSNLGTTSTALLAAMASSGNKRDPIQIALVHTFFNIFGILIFYPIPFMRWPIPLCKKLGNTTADYRWFPILYLIAMFFIMPGSIFALSLGGTIVLWSVLGPFLILLIFVVIINLLQTRKPNLLPNILQDWNFLPKPFRSLEPYDKLVTSPPCCKKCRESSIHHHEEPEIIMAYDQQKHMLNGGIDNPIPVTD